MFLLDMKDYCYKWLKKKAKNSFLNGNNNKTFVIDLKLFRKSIDNLDDDVDDAK